MELKRWQDERRKLKDSAGVKKGAGAKHRSKSRESILLGYSTKTQERTRSGFLPNSRPQDKLMPRCDSMVVCRKVSSTVGAASASSASAAYSAQSNAGKNDISAGANPWVQDTWLAPDIANQLEEMRKRICELEVTVFELQQQVSLSN